MKGFVLFILESITGLVSIGLWILFERCCWKKKKTYAHWIMQFNAVVFYDDYDYVLHNAYSYLVSNKGISNILEEGLHTSRIWSFEMCNYFWKNTVTAEYYLTNEYDLKGYWSMIMLYKNFIFRQWAPVTMDCKIIRWSWRN